LTFDDFKVVADNLQTTVQQLEDDIVELAEEYMKDGWAEDYALDQATTDVMDLGSSYNRQRNYKWEAQVIIGGQAYELPAEMLEKLKKAISEKNGQLLKQKEKLEKALGDSEMMVQNVTANYESRIKHLTEQVELLRAKLEGVNLKLTEIHSLPEASRIDKIRDDLYEEWCTLKAYKDAQIEELENKLQAIRDVAPKIVPDGKLVGRPVNVVVASSDQVPVLCHQIQELQEQVEDLKKKAASVHEAKKEAKISMKVPKNQTVRDRIQAHKATLKERGVPVPHFPLDHIKDAQERNILLAAKLAELVNATAPKTQGYDTYTSGIAVEKKKETSKMEAPVLGSKAFDAPGDTVFYGVCVQHNGQMEFYKRIDKVGNYLVTCIHHDLNEKAEGQKLTVGKFTAKNPMKPMETEEVPIVRLDLKRDLAVCALPKKIMQGYKSFRPVVMEKGEERTVVVWGVGTEQTPQTFRRTSGVAHADGRLTGTTFVGWSGAVIVDDKDCLGIHLRGPTTSDPNNKEPNEGLRWTSEDVSFLTGAPSLN